MARGTEAPTRLKISLTRLQWRALGAASQVQCRARENIATARERQCCEQLQTLQHCATSAAFDAAVAAAAAAIYIRARSQRDQATVSPPPSCACICRASRELNDARPAFGRTRMPPITTRLVESSRHWRACVCNQLCSARALLTSAHRSFANWQSLIAHTHTYIRASAH